MTNKSYFSNEIFTFWGTVMVMINWQKDIELRGRPILLITRMIIDRIELHSVLLPLLIF